MITQVTTCKGRLSDVERHIEKWLASGIDELVLVDYACPEHTAAKLLNNRLGCDPRVTLVRVPECVQMGRTSMDVAGPRFNLSRARNLGSMCARHEHLFFLDADCWVASSFISAVQDMIDEYDGTPSPDLIVAGPHCRYPETEQLPASWVKDGQCIVRNSIFRRVNGYAETHEDWGAESYDLYARLSAASGSIAVSFFDASRIQIFPHSDDVRFEFRRTSRLSRDERYIQATTALAAARDKHTRVGPGRGMGFHERLHPYIVLFRGGQRRHWKPGEDDIL